MPTFDPFFGIASVFRRHVLVYSRQWRHSLTATFAEPILSLLLFGFGVSSVVQEVNAGGQTVNYRAFMFSGIVAQCALFQGFFSAAYGSYARMHQQRLFRAILTTPVTLSELLWAELLWNAVPATLASCAILLLGAVAGDFRPVGALVAVLLCFVAALIFSALGMCAAALSRDFNDLSTARLYVVFPCLLLSGMLFPLDSLPAPVWFLASVLPLTSALELLRGLLLGIVPSTASPWLLTAWLGLSVFAARRTMTTRMVR